MFRFCLYVVQFTLGYIEAYFTSYTGNKGLWKTDPEGILVILGEFVLYGFKKMLIQQVLKIRSFTIFRKPIVAGI